MKAKLSKVAEKPLYTFNADIFDDGGKHIHTFTADAQDEDSFMGMYTAQIQEETGRKDEPIELMGD